MLKKLFFAITIILLPVVAIAQDWKADLEKAYAIFAEKNLEMEVEHLFYPAVNATEPIERQTVWMMRMGDNYHIRQYGMEIIRNSRYTLFVNEPARIIGISDTEIKLPAEQKEASTELEEMLKIMTEYLGTLEVDSAQQKETYTVNYAGVSEGTKKYRFDYKEGKFLYSTVYLSNKTGLLEKISCVVREPVEVEEGVFRQVRIDLVYRKQETGTKFSEAMFTIGHIVQVNSQGEAILTEKYQQYRLLNNIVKQ